MIICFYHRADHDGQTSAAIVRRKYPECKLIGVDYSDATFPWDIINQNDTIIMVDFSLKPVDRMIHMSKKGRFIWIDHHVSAIKEAESAGFQPEGLRVIGKSGCELTWEFFFPDQQIPRVIHHLGRYDVFDLSDPITLPFHYGMEKLQTDPMDDIFWKDIFEDNDAFFFKTLEEGQVIFDYCAKKDAGFAKSQSFVSYIDGHKGIFLNGARDSLTFYEVWDPKEYAMMVGFSCKGDTISVSLYADGSGLDVSKIAGKYGGGGHAGASGFTITTDHPLAEVFFPKLS